MGKRRRAREMAMQMLYQQELGGSSVAQVIDGFEIEEYGSDDSDESDSKELVDESIPPSLAHSFVYAKQLFEGTIGHVEEIDSVICQFAENWRIERMPTIDRNILRIAIYEMLHEKNVPKVVIVDEAIELAKRFGSENSGRFVNGLLDGFLKSQVVNPVASDSRT